MQAKITLLHMALLVQTQQAQAPLGTNKLYVESLINIFYGSVCKGKDHNLLDHPRTISSRAEARRTPVG